MLGLDLIPPSTLSDGVVTLRPWRPADAAAISEAARSSVATVGPWMDWCHAAYSQADADAWIEKCAADWARQDAYEYGIFDPSSGGVLGGVGLNQINRAHRFGNLGYWVRSSATRSGIASRAARLVARFGLTAAELGRIEILTATNNLASQRVADKIGATFEGVLRDRLLVRGQRIPARLYSLVRQDLLGSLA